MDGGGFLAEMDDMVFTSPEFGRISKTGDTDVRRAPLGFMWFGPERSEGVLGCEKEVMAWPVSFYGIS